jgi:hypothetical protein
LDSYLTPDDPGFQGSELPAGFMINYHMYRNYWPLTALGRYRGFLHAQASPANTTIAGVASKL